MSILENDDHRILQFDAGDVCYVEILSMPICINDHDRFWLLLAVAQPLAAAKVKIAEMQTALTILRMDYPLALAERTFPTS